MNYRVSSAVFCWANWFLLPLGDPLRIKWPKSARVCISLCCHTEIKIHVTHQDQVWDFELHNINVLLRISVLDILKVGVVFWFLFLYQHDYLCLFSLLLKCNLSLFPVVAFDPNRTLGILLDVWRTVLMIGMLSIAKMHHKSLKRKGRKTGRFLRESTPSSCHQALPDRCLFYFLLIFF